MHIVHSSVISLLEYVKIDSFNVVCHFKCKQTNKTIISSVPFEPYEGKIEFTWMDIFFHPFKSYNRYYHTPIIIYGDDTYETIVLKAFKKVSNHFQYNKEKNSYTYV
jgi:hypothetical protein